MADALYENNLWDGIELNDMAIIDGLQNFKKLHRSQWEKFARDVWRVGNKLAKV